LLGSLTLREPLGVVLRAGHIADCKYLNDVVGHHRLDIRTGVTVTGISGAYVVATPAFIHHHLVLSPAISPLFVRLFVKKCGRVKQIRKGPGISTTQSNL